MRTARRYSFQTAWRGTRTAKRLKTCKHSSHRLAGQSPPPGANAPDSTVSVFIAWRVDSRR